MPNTSREKSSAINKPSISEKIESMIQKKKMEKGESESIHVSEAQTGTQSEVAEVMSGVEKPSEKVSEKKGESGEKGDIKASSGSASGDDDTGSFQGIPASQLPNEAIMVRKVRTAIKKEIEYQLKLAMKYQGNLTTGSAQEYSSIIAKIRKLKESLSGLFRSSFDFVKNLYLHYFTPDGKRRPLDELE